jgi:hypothetical protein
MTKIYIGIGMQSYNDVYFQHFTSQKDAINGILKHIHDNFEYPNKEIPNFDELTIEDLLNTGETFVYGDEYRYFIKEIEA